MKLAIKGYRDAAIGLQRWLHELGTLTLDERVAIVLPLYHALSLEVTRLVHEECRQTDIRERAA